jgi:hypothetical protein
MPISDTVESNRLKLYFKNSDLLQFEPCISLVINEFDDIPTDRFFELLNLLKSWFIKDVYLQTSNLDSLSRIEGNLIKEFRLYVQLSKDIDTLLKSNIAETDEFLSKYIFSTAEYYKETSHLGQSVINIFGNHPEIYLLHPRNKVIKIKLKNSEDIEALFLFDGKKTVECTQDLNFNTGIFKTQKSAGEYKLLVLRKLRVQECKGKLIYRLNHFNKIILDSTLKEIVKKLKRYKECIYGVYHDLDDILRLPYDNTLFLSDDVNNSENLKNIAEYSLTDRPSNGYYKSIIDRVYKKKLSSSFLAKLNSVFSRVKYFVEAENSHVLNTEFTFQSVFKIDAMRFYHETPYFDDVSINLRRTLSARHAQDISDLTVSIHNIFNTRYSFSQKKHHLDYLFTLGVDKIMFNTENILQILSYDSINSISEIDPNYMGYAEWFYYLHQLGNLMKKGIEKNDILILYPSLDYDNGNFRIVINELEHIGYSSELVKYDDFENNIICSLEHDRINFNNKLFKIILLPGIKNVSLKVIEKLHNFFENGGIVISVQQLPESAGSKKNTEKLRKLKRKIWLDEAEIKSTNFRQNENGGYGFYQPEIEKLADMLLILENYINFRVISNSKKLKYIIKETDREVYIFITNLNDDSAVPFVIKTKYLGKPFVWNFKIGESYAFGMWYVEKEWMYLNDTLNAHESRLYVLDKKSSLKTWQMKKAAFTGCKVLKQNTTMLKLKGWMRDNRDVDLELIKDKKHISQKIKGVKVSPVLVISSKKWYLDSDTFQGKVNLGNYAFKAPYESHVLLYQKIIIIHKDYLKNQKLFLEIGKVLDWCTLFVNDDLVEQLLSPPWIFDITRFVHEGENKITIKVVNNLSNRLAKDDRRHEFAVREYGLFGPVRIVPYNIFNLKI